MKHPDIPQRYIDFAIEDLGNYQHDLAAIESKVTFHEKNADVYRELVADHIARGADTKAFLKLAGVSDDDLLKEVGDDSAG